MLQWSNLRSTALARPRAPWYSAEKTYSANSIAA